MKKTPMTRDGFNILKDKYNHLRNVVLKEYVQALTDARDKGDISENTEYEVAKQNLDELHDKMSKMNLMLSNSFILDSIIDDGTVQLLTWVKIKNLITLNESEYKIVPENESDIKNNKISINSPIGSNLLNKKIGDIIDIKIPKGNIKLEILNIKLFQ